MRRISLCRYLTTLLVLSGAGTAQAGDAGLFSRTGLPLFSQSPWGSWKDPPGDKWERSYVSMTSGFAVTRFGKGRSASGPVVGIETGKYWRDGQWVYGITADADYLHNTSRFVRPGYGFAGRGFEGGARMKMGFLPRPDLLVYGSIGAVGVNETWRVPRGLGWSTESQFTVRPEMRAGAQWAVTDNLSVTVEVGVRPALR